MRYLIFVFLSLTFNEGNASLICNNYQVPKIYSLMRTEVESDIEKFSNKKIISEYAGTIFSKLIAAKSPFITSWYQNGNFSGKSEIEVANAWRQYYARNFLLMKMKL